MSINDRVIDDNYAYSSKLWGILIDFDKSKISSIRSDSTYIFQKGL